MSEQNSAISVTLKGGPGYDAPWVVIHGDNPDQIKTRVDGVRQLGILGLAAEAAAEFGAVVVAARDLGAVVVPTPPEAPSAWAPTPPVSSPAPQAYVAPAPAAPAPAQAGSANGTPFTKTDRYGNTWEYNNPQAPMSPRGPMVKGTRQKKDRSGSYTKWYDPADKPCPLWREQGNPPVDPSQIVESQWAN